jgi:GWxTD domain-containing protein
MVNPMANLHPRRGLAAFVLAALGPAVLVWTLAAVSGCRLYNIERKLSPAHADFVSKVGYIISREERKIFLELPDEAKDGFIEEFWKRRDPDPDTERNEYRVEYEERLERARILFHGEGRAGWQTDRGRIYVLFGPPTERSTYPMELGGTCREVWYYGAFPVVFIDEHCSGHYIMTAINLEHLQKLNIAQGYFQKTLSPAKRFFDYDVSMEKVRSGEDAYEGKVFVDVPYTTIWFTFKDGRLETAFEVRLELTDESGTVLWEGGGDFPLSLEERELTENRTRRFRMEFPFLIDRDLDRLKTQKLRLEVSVKSTTEGEELKKAVSFQLKF